MSSKPRFIADRMLGRLARWLRLLGFDTLTADQVLGGNIGVCSLREGRVILTRSKRFGPWRSLRLIYITSGDFREQIREVFREAEIKTEDLNLYSRCSMCNGSLEPATPGQVEKTAPRDVIEKGKTFSWCGRCRRLYWEGTHAELFKKDLNAIKTAAG